MGFGLTFIGYFIAYFVSWVFAPVKLLGYALITWGSIKLSEYNTRFRMCTLPLGFLCVSGVYSLLGYFYNLFGIQSTLFGTGVLNVVSNVSEAIDVSFHACLLIAVCSIAKETELPKMAYNSMRNLIVVIASELVYFVSLFMPEGQAGGIVSYVAVVLRLLWTILNTVLLANCYKMICPEGEEDMPVVESKNPIIRKMDAVISKREENARQAAVDLVRRRREKKYDKPIVHKKRKRK